ncbi:MAG: ATP-binding cassette domain-containing protein [Lachnospiraceae bacterium]|nr:ATP-binding cassette domain-containing protein [Lachnospiraceae bacterium]
MRLEVDIEKKLGSFCLQSCFSVEEETFALLGASGCGKSMTLRCIAGIEKPDRGRIVLGDTVFFDSEKKINLPARQRRVGYLFQDYALFPNMTAARNVYCAAKDRAYADELISRFCMEDVADQYPSELSGGQSQRTALARMLVTKPQILLFDEPFSALDNFMRTRMEHVILDLLATFQGPSIFVTHDRNEAYRMAARIGVMQDGRIAEQKEKREFFDHPQTVAGARLTGCKNISRAFRLENGSFHATDWGLKIRIPEGQPMDGVTHIGIRAHYFTYVDPDSLQGEKASGEEHPADQDGRKTAAKKKKSGSESEVIQCRLVRVIEDTFETVVCFTAEGNTEDTPDALLSWVLDKKEWNRVKDQVQSGSFSLRMDTERLLYLRE